MFNRVLWVLKALWIVLSETINILRNLHKANILGMSRKFYQRFMYIAPSSGYALIFFFFFFFLLQVGLRLFSDVCMSENAALFERLMEIRSTPTNTILWL